MTLTPTQRARNLARLERGGRRELARVAADDLEPDLPRSGVGRVGVDGTAFDWMSSLFVDPERGALYDGGDQEARDVREALESDWKMRQLSEVLTSSIKGASWKLIPHKEDTGEAADTEEKLRRPEHAGGMATPMRRVIGQATSSIYFKRAYFAKGFKLDPVKADGSVMYRELAMRPASTCRLVLDADTGRYQGFEQDIVYYGEKSTRRWDGRPVRFPAEKALVFVNGRDKDPVSGVSDLEVAMWCWQTKRKVMLLWLTYLAASALPRTLVKHKGDENRAIAAARMISTLSSGGVGYIDASQIDVALLDPSGKGSAPFVEMAKYLDSCQSGSVLAGFTDLTSAASDGKGSFALSADSRDMFSQTRTHAAGDIEETLTNEAVAPLVRYNYGPAGKVPEFKFDALAGVDEEPLMTLLSALATAPSSSLPQEFINELAVHAARLLDLDVDKIKTALESSAFKAQQEAKTRGANAVGQQAAQVAGAIGGVRHIARTITGAAGGGGGGSNASHPRPARVVPAGGRKSA